MFEIVLVHPEIPPNTGNIIRLAANMGARLHLVHPLGFDLEDRQLRRAGLDYHDLSDVSEHADFDSFLSTVNPSRMFMLSSHYARRYTEPDYLPGDAFVFGAETRGLPDDVRMLAAPDHRLTLPMRPGNRSLNLSNSVAVVLYEAWRQQRFVGAA
ncbi:MAG: tRNA (cytidine(34)-2'-O)-methyltransferase [Gammaproteobacteria bacterium]